MEKTDLLIANRRVATQEYTEVRDPGRTGEVVGLLAQGSAEDVDVAVCTAHHALSAWGEVPAQDRAVLLMTIADILATAGPDVTELMARESGMLVPTNAAELLMAAAVIRDNAELAVPFLSSERVEDDLSTVTVDKAPVGVIAAIIPWNAPVILAMRKVAPALMCGNTVVLKTAPTAALGLSKLLERIAKVLPPGVLNVMHGGAEVGSALVNHPLVRKISFTGGGAVARSIMKQAAGSIKGVQFELGGNDPAIVMADVDIDRMVPRIVGGAFRRSGQFCFAVKRVYVPEPLYDEFFQKLCAEVDRFIVGHPLDEGVNFGPINNEAQFRHLQDLLAHTRSEGQDVHTLGAVRDHSSWSQGYYLRPSVVRHADPESRVVREEQFGPILPIVSYTNLDDAIRWANDDELGLASSVWSRDVEAAAAVAMRLEAGMTFINNAGTSRVGQRHSPFGGVKRSGIGRESSEAGLAEYVEHHSIDVHKKWETR